MKKSLRILHYALGYPPARSGGQVWYVLDLIHEQISAGHKVAYLYPGRLNLFFHSPYVKTITTKDSTKEYKFELVNSLPLPLFGGIRQPEDFLKPSNMNIFLRLFEEFRPDVIHVHTVMGLYKEFLLAAKQRSIPVIFTSHDYFGLSPVPDFYHAGKSWHAENSTAFWCNVATQRAMSTQMLRVFQLKIYPYLRNLLKRIRGTKYAAPDLLPPTNYSWSTKYAENMDKLRSYYQDIFSMVDHFHFNSTVARDVFCKNLEFNLSSFTVVPVTNSSVTKKLVLKRLTGYPKKIAYIGPYLEYKGFFDFLDIASKNTDPNLEFHLWGDDRQLVSDKVFNHGRFLRSDIDQVFSCIDVLVFPSRWQETFGLVVIEALDHGVPVLVSSNAGVKDLLQSGWIFCTKEELYKKINFLLRELPSSIHSNLRTMAEHAEDISVIYQGCLK